MTPRVLVVGCGFIGSRLAAHLIERGATTTVLTRTPPPPARRPQGAQVIVGDASDGSVVARAVRGQDHVVYCAGGLLPADSVTHPWDDATLSLNPLLTTLETLRRTASASLTYLSSGGTVYGRPRTLPVSEDHATDPITAYGVSKLAAEKYIGMYRHLYAVPARILRCANVYGPGQQPGSGQGAVAAFLDSAQHRRPVVVFGDGSVVRDFIHVDETVQVIAGLIGRDDVPQVLNVGSGRATSLAELIEVVSDVTGGPLLLDRRADRAFDVHEIVLDISRLQRATGFTPMPLRDGVAQTWAHLLGPDSALAMSPAP